MTPAETFATIDGYAWNQEQQQKREIAGSWRTAVLSRAKKVPPLAQLLAGDAKPLTGKELEKRQAEFENLTSKIDLDAINKQARNKKP